MASSGTTQAHDVPFDGKSVYICKVPVLDPSFYSLSEAEAAFFKATTGIHDDEELKTHILMAQENAYNVGHFLACPTIHVDRPKFRLRHILVYTDLDSCGV